MLPLASSLLPLKWLCSLSRTETAVPNPKFGVYITYIFLLQYTNGFVRFLLPKVVADAKTL